jgi:ubiquinone/menaquinone biosynthesis C-methylase UbiE
MAKFNAVDYRQFRPFYPAETFRGLKEELLKNGFIEPFTISDIGCGTGHSAISLLRTGMAAHVIGIDPDPRMLEQARVWVHSEKIKTIDFQIGQGERTGLESRSVDAVLVGSAFHWMNPEQARNEFARILKPNGIIRIFEYQFPKAQHRPELNEWIRRQFNLRWKAIAQKPRGTLTQMTEGFRKDIRFRSLSSGRPPMIQELSASELSGLLFSQSRVLCFEETLSISEKSNFRQEVEETVQMWMGSQSATFDFKLGWHDFALKEPA